ncbi:MAG TPA: hypothetical protein VJT74_09330 [Pyrinomonadaceae bacterium]|nr:hypothetical protein [Pyrinomonadaceae bacterium]
MRMKLTHVVRLALILLALALVSQPLIVLHGAKAETAAPAHAPAPAPQASDSNLVGSFKLHVQIQQRRVEVKDEKGGATQLLADFAAWDAQSRVAAINVAVKNVGAAALNGSLDAAVVKIASPKVTPLNADGATQTGSPTFAYSGVSLPSGATSAPREWQFKSPQAMDFQLDVELRLSPRTPIPAGTGATVMGPDGTRLTIQPNSVPYDVFVDIKSVPASAVEAPLGALEFVGAVEVTFEPAAELESALLAPPSAPLTLSIPAPAGLTTSKFVVGEQLSVDAIDQETPGLSPRLMATDTATLSGGQIVTEANVFPGIFDGGTFVFVANHGSGFATGVASDLKGPQAGVVVSNNTNTLVSVTDGGGNYQLYINGGPFNVTGFDPLKGSSGTGSGNIAVSGSTVTANINLTPLASPPVTRDGIRNGGFERGDLSSWSTVGSAEATNVFISSGPGRVRLTPTEGFWMADVSTGGNAVGGVGSGLKQKFKVPAGAKTLTFDFDFISEEFPEFVNTPFDDSFRAVITTSDNQMTFAEVSVNQSGGYKLIGDCGFPGGDTTCGHTGWTTGSVDLSAYAGTNTPITVELLFSAIDAGDNIYDTHVLIDNIRFSTVWIDAKFGLVALADRDRVLNDILFANEILSQAGINLQLTDARLITNVNGLVPDVTFKRDCSSCKFVPTADIISLLGDSRSSTATDVNTYYVSSMIETTRPAREVIGLTVSPDDYLGVDILASSGIILTDGAADCEPEGRALAHELGHLLISPQRAEDFLEHKAGRANFMRPNCSKSTKGIITRRQSANINRTDAKLLTP